MQFLKVIFNKKYLNRCSQEIRFCWCDLKKFYEPSWLLKNILFVVLNTKTHIKILKLVANKQNGTLRSVWGKMVKKAKKKTTRYCHYKYSSLIMKLSWTINKYETCWFHIEFKLFRYESHTFILVNIKSNIYFSIKIWTFCYIFLHLSFSLEINIASKWSRQSNPLKIPAVIDDNRETLLKVE